MVGEPESGRSQSLTLDHFSFEKLLAAAWVLQCLHDQLHHQNAVRDDTNSDFVSTSAPQQTADERLPATLETVAQPSLPSSYLESTLDFPNSRGGDDGLLEEPVTQQPAEAGTPRTEGPVNVEPEIAESWIGPEHLTTPPAPVLQKAANDNAYARVFLPLFNVLRVNLRATLCRTRDALTNLRPALRLNLPLRAIRAVAIAVPVLVLTVVAASLLLKTWHREPLNGVQPISSSNAPAVVTVNDIPTAQTTTKRAAFGDHKTIPHRKLGRPSPISPPRSSHRQVTDPATLFAVKRLSKYEIKALRRQAKYGDAAAAFTLGMAYEVGKNVPQNCAEATRWVTTAAEAGDAAAEYNLGLRYRDGDGVPANRAESAKWLRKAAARRYAKANRALKMLASR